MSGDEYWVLWIYRRGAKDIRIIEHGPYTSFEEANKVIDIYWKRMKRKGKLLGVNIQKRGVI